MRSMRYTNIAKSDLLYLFGIGEQVFQRWVKQGLPCEPDSGRFSLVKVIRWREKCHHTIERQQVKVDGLSQQQLAGLLGVSRQTLSAWGQSGLKKTNGGYNLKYVCRWMRCYYQGLAAKSYQKRLTNLRKKLCRNVRQLERFFEHENNIFREHKNGNQTSGKQ